MEIAKTEESWGVTLKLKGEIDLHASPLLRAELQKCVASKVPRLILDFTDVEYIDSSGLATLIEYVREAGKSGKLALFGLKKRVRTIFDLVRLNELFDIEETQSDAVKALAG